MDISDVVRLVGDHLTNQTLIHDDNFSFRTMIPPPIRGLTHRAAVEVIKLMKDCFSQVSQSEATLQMSQAAYRLSEYHPTSLERLIRLFF